jgi:dCTP deaminase
MYLTDRDLKHAVARGHLIVDPAPLEYDTTGIDLHLDHIEEARVWDHSSFEKAQSDSGNRPWLGVGGFDYQAFANKYTLPVQSRGADSQQRVWRDGNRIILAPGGFFLWQTREVVGTPVEDARYICFIDGKSTRARIGLLVHMTAPTIHAGWWGKVTLEIANLGPFQLALEEGDAVAQIVVAMVSSPPEKKKAANGVDVGQQSVSKPRRRKGDNKSG